jgi:hypothetical protein
MIRSMMRLIAVGVTLGLLVACQQAPDINIAPTISPSTATPTEPPTNTPSPIPPTLTATPEPTDEPLLIDGPMPIPTQSRESATDVWAFPGPLHYEGDLLDVIFEADDNFDEELPVTVQVDNQSTRHLTAVADYFFQPTYRINNAFDTTGKAGSHTLTVTLDDGLRFVYQFEVLPADQRPESEADAEWETLEIECCVLHYLTHTAAARDIEHIAELAQDATDDVEAMAGHSLADKFMIVLMDRMWFNGGFGGSGAIAVSYTDRPYSSLQGDIGLSTVLHHEATHALGEEDGSQFMLGEGIAVFFAGGHYKPEPFAQRGAALFDLGWYRRLGELGLNHETRYLQEALIIDYIKEVYGDDALEKFLSYRVPGLTEEEFPEYMQWFEGAIPAAIGKSLDQFQTEYEAWLDATDPGDQMDDLYLTVILQELRREYQRQYAPYPMSVFLIPDELYQDPELIPDLIREPHAPINIAFEVLIMHAQQALQAGRYEEVNAMIEILRAGLVEGNLDAGPLADYRSIAEAAAEAGYEVVDIHINGDTADVQAFREEPEIEDLTMLRNGDQWVIEK